ncbi:hypothetical protein [Legionella tucsonensis]|uniref:DED domain-containing protein n=1 Tax=Legionella tucsonensis TaxID=40335 RepID=A0A0W0ZVX7_9GAMM|nr:hypothetical protein [Legionella tucsonensis]KTD73220.1 hypothetical protein Ltuc_1067 [Legionella tucsonensis]
MYNKREERKKKEASSSPVNQFFEIDFIKNTVNSNSGYVPSSTQPATIREGAKKVERQKLLEDVSRAFDSKDELILRANFLFEAVLLGDFYKLTLYKYDISFDREFSRSNLVNRLEAYHILNEKDLDELKEIINDVKNIRIEKVLSTDADISTHYVLSVQCPNKRNSKFKIENISFFGKMIEKIVTPQIYSPYQEEEDNTPEFRESFLTKYNQSGFETIFNGHFFIHSNFVPFYKIYEENADKENENLLSAYGNLEIANYLLTQENVSDKEYNEAKQFFAKAVFSFNKFYFARGNISTHLAYIVSPMLATMNLLAKKEKNMDTVECIKVLEAASIFRDVFLDKMKEVYKNEFKQVCFEFLNESAKLEQLCQEVAYQIKNSQSIPLANLFFNAKNIPLEIKCNLLDGLKLTHEEKKTILKNLAMQADTLWYQADIKEKYLMISKIYHPLIELMDTKELESLLQSSSASVEMKTMICRDLIHRTNMSDVKAVDHLINLMNDFRFALKEMKLDENNLKDRDELYESLYKLLALQMNFDMEFDEPVLTDEYLDYLVLQWRLWPNENKQEKVQEKSIEKKEQKPGLFSQSEYQRMQLRQIQKEKAIKHYLETVPHVLHSLSNQAEQTQGLLAKLKELMPHVINKEEFHSSFFPDKSDKDQLESPLITNVNSSLAMMRELEGMLKEINATIAVLKEKNHPQAAEQYDPLMENVQHEIAVAKINTTYNLDVQMIRVEKLLAEANDKFSQLSTQLIVKNSSLKDIYNDFLIPAEKAYVEMEKITDKYLKLAVTLDGIIEKSIKRENNQEYYSMQSQFR